MQEYIYDNGGALKKVKLDGLNYVNDIRYDAKGQRQAIWYGNDSKTSYRYDPKTYRLSRLFTVNGKTGSPQYNKMLQDLYYYYDPVGNITRIRDEVQDYVFYNNTVISPHQVYTYDALYRLVIAEGREHISNTGFNNKDNNSDSGMIVSPAPLQWDINALQTYTQRFSYDAVGNIRELKHSAAHGGYTRTYTYTGSNNRLTKTTVGSMDYGYTYDIRGNMAHMPHLSVMAWNSLNELYSIANSDMQTWYQYSGGQRIRKYVEKATGVEERIYLGNFEIYRKFETLGSLTPLVERTTVHISDDTGRIAMRELRNTDYDDDGSKEKLTRYIYSNHLQSASLELDENAAVISYEEYHPYGTTAYQASNSVINAVAKRYRYTGKERDDESGLYYHGARYYVPWLGRWTASDPLESKYAGMSPYNYCLNNPVANIDSDGRDVITFHYLHSVQNSLLEKSDNKRDNTSLRSFGKSNVASGSSSSYLWLTVEKNGQPNSYQIEETTVNSYWDGKSTAIARKSGELGNPNYNFDYNQELYKAVHDFKDVLSSTYGPEISSSNSSQKGSIAANQINALLKREREYTHEQQINQGVNQLMLGLVEAVAIELVIAEIATGGSLLLSAGRTADISVLLKEVNILSKEEMALIKGGGVGDGVTFTESETAAAHRLGFFPEEVVINNGVAEIPITYMDIVRPSDITAVSTALKGNGATSIRMSSGPIINADITPRLQKASESGKTFLGFEVTNTGNPENMYILTKNLQKMSNVNIEARIRRNKLDELAGEFYRNSDSKIVNLLNENNKNAILGIQDGDGIYTLIGEKSVYYSTHSEFQGEISHENLLETLKKNAMNLGKKGQFEFVEIDQQEPIWVMNELVMNALWNTVLFLYRNYSKG